MNLSHAAPEAGLFFALRPGTRLEFLVMSNDPRSLMNRAIRVWICIACAPALIAAGGPVLAQSYPNRPVRIILPVPPGGGVDVLGRIVAQKLGEALG